MCRQVLPCTGVSYNARLVAWRCCSSPHIAARTIKRVLPDGAADDVQPFCLVQGSRPACRRRQAATPRSRSMRSRPEACRCGQAPLSSPQRPSWTAAPLPLMLTARRDQVLRRSWRMHYIAVASWSAHMHVLMLPTESISDRQFAAACCDAICVHVSDAGGKRKRWKNRTEQQEAVHKLAQLRYRCVAWICRSTLGVTTIRRRSV